MYKMLSNRMVESVFHVQGPGFQQSQNHQKPKGKEGKGKKM